MQRLAVLPEQVLNEGRAPSHAHLDALEALAELHHCLRLAVHLEQAVQCVLLELLRVLGALLAEGRAELEHLLESPLELEHKLPQEGRALRLNRLCHQRRKRLLVLVNGRGHGREKWYRANTRCKRGAPLTFAVTVRAEHLVGPRFVSQARVRHATRAPFGRMRCSLSLSQRELAASCVLVFTSPALHVFVAAPAACGREAVWTHYSARGGGRPAPVEHQALCAPLGRLLLPLTGAVPDAFCALTYRGAHTNVALTTSGA